MKSEKRIKKIFLCSELKCKEDCEKIANSVLKKYREKKWIKKSYLNNKLRYSLKELDLIAKEFNKSKEFQISIRLDYPAVRDFLEVIRDNSIKANKILEEK